MTNNPFKKYQKYLLYKKSLNLQKDEKKCFFFSQKSGNKIKTTKDNKTNDWQMLPLTMKSKCRCFKCFNQSHSEIPSRDRSSLNGMETGKRKYYKNSHLWCFNEKRFIYLLLCKYQPQHVNQQ